ncbi:MAG TPA: hypothetical protein P5123_13020, partial [Spirochaetota bacterium]|nr:hypothetical protein [Spirochaetota bacterium]
MKLSSRYFVLVSFLLVIVSIACTNNKDNNNPDPILNEPLFNCGEETDNPDAIIIKESNCKVIIENDDPGYYKNTPGKVNGVTINAGDTICLKAGTRRGTNKGFYFNGLTGTSANPIKIVNLNGFFDLQDDFGYSFKLDNCNHLRITGTGSQDYFYGIRISSTMGNMMEVTGDSSNIEIDHVSFGSRNHIDDPDYFAGKECHDIRFKTDATPAGPCREAANAIMVKNDPACNSPYNGDTGFFMENIHIHHNRFEYVAQAIYVGYKNYEGTYRNCDDDPTTGENGNETLTVPHDIKNIQVHNNCIMHTMKDGAQFKNLSSIKSRKINDPTNFTDPGVESSIYNNHILFHSEKQLATQMSGLLVGTGSACNIYNNIIANGYGSAMELGIYAGKTYNNLLINPGNPESNITAINSSEKCTDLESIQDSLTSTPGIRILNNDHVDFNDNSIERKIEFYHNTIANGYNGIEIRDNGDFDIKIHNNLIIAARSFDEIFYKAYCEWGWTRENAFIRSLATSFIKVAFGYMVNGETADTDAKNI